MWNLIKHEIPEMLDNWRVIPRLLIFMYAVVFTPNNELVYVIRKSK